MKKKYIALFILCTILQPLNYLRAEDRLPAQQQEEIAAPTDTAIFKQMKKNCDELSSTIEILEKNLQSEEFLKQNITIAELNELIKRVQEDLKTRFDYLDRSDKKEILKIIKEKEQVLLKQKKELEIILMPNTQQKKPLSLLAKSILTLGILSALCIGIASCEVIGSNYDRPDTYRPTSPTIQNFRSNIYTMLNALADLIYP